MILTKSVFIKMNGKHIQKYIDMGYKCKTGDIIEIKVSDLPFKSKSLVRVKCDVCKFEKEIKYYVYSKNNINCNYYSCSIKCGIGKYKHNMMEKYGVDNYAKTDEAKEKMKNTNLKRYGSIAPAGNSNVMSKMVKTRVERGYQNEFNEIDEFVLYKKLVRKITNINKKELFDNWDGNDHYDNEYIKDYLSINSNSRLYPTIDHKVSVYYGYKNNIIAEEIASLNNLCITKRGINSSKSNKTYETFKVL